MKFTYDNKNRHTIQDSLLFIFISQNDKLNNSSSVKTITKSFKKV